MMLKRLTTLVTAVSLFLSACTRHDDIWLSEQSKPLYTIAEAEKAYELARMGLSRSDAEDGVLTMGTYQPDWSEAEISIDSTLYSADVPIEGEYAYYRYLEIEGEVFWIPLYPKMVTVTTPDKEHSSVYIRYYVPHEYYEWSHDPEVYDQLLNSLPKQDFTGLSLYTTLSGDPVCVARYNRGSLKAYAFLFDNAHTAEENVAMMNTILNGLRVGRATKSTSRGVDDINVIEPVVVVGEMPEKEDQDQGSEQEDDAVVREEVSPVVNREGGSPGATGNTTPSDDDSDSEGETSSKYNDAIKYTDKDIVEPLLDSIAKDCMGGTLLEGLGDVTIVTNSDRNSYNSETNTIYLKNDPAYGFRDYVFLEELIHAYQFQNQSDASGRALNNEIEAKVGWLLYKDRLNDPLSETLQIRAFKTPKTAQAVLLLASYFQAGISFDNEYFVSQYYIVANGLKRDLYPNISYKEEFTDFNVLIALMINCPEL